MVYVGTNGWDFRVNISHSCRPANAPPTGLAMSEYVIHYLMKMRNRTQPETKLLIFYVSSLESTLFADLPKTNNFVNHLFLKMTSYVKTVCIRHLPEFCKML